MFKLIKTFVIIMGVISLIILNCGCSNNTKNVTSEEQDLSSISNMYSDVWGSSSSDVFIVGANGKILHYDGNDWSNMDSGTSQILTSIWGSSATDIYAVGYNGIILHYDGEKWTNMQSKVKANLKSIWGFSSSGVFAVGEGGTILNFNGKTWEKMSSGIQNNLLGVWGSSPSDVYAVGQASDAFIGGQNYDCISHFDGRNWQEVKYGYANVLHGISGVSSSDIFAVGGVLLHYGHNYNNTDSWMSIGAEFLYLYDVWCYSASEGFAVGDGGNILHYDGIGWKKMTSNTANDLLGVWGSSPSDVYAVGVGIITHFDGETWSENIIGNVLSHD